MQLTLTVLQETARVHEAVNTQMQSMGSLELASKENQSKRTPKKRKGEDMKEVWKRKEGC